MSDRVQKIVRLTDIRNTLYEALATVRTKFDTKHKTYLQMVEQHDKTTQARPSASHRQSFGEVYQQIHGEIRELDVEIERQETLYNQEHSRLTSLDAEITKSNADIAMEISNHNSQVAARPYAVCGNSVVAKRYALGLLTSRRDAQLSKVVDLRKKIDETKEKRDTNSRVFSNMNADIIAWLDGDKLYQEAAERIEVQLAELHKIRGEYDDIVRQIKDVEADIKKYQLM